MSLFFLVGFLAIAALIAVGTGMVESPWETPTSAARTENTPVQASDIDEESGPSLSQLARHCRAIDDPELRGECFEYLADEQAKEQYEADKDRYLDDPECDPYYNVMAGEVSGCD
jgi:hypothetical protein